MRPNKVFITALVYLSTGKICFSFTLHTQASKSIPITRNNLVPEQATQLVAASTATLASLGKQETEENTLTNQDTGEQIPKNDKKEKNGNVAIARSFISKIFNAPSHQGREDYGFGSLSSQLFQNVKDQDVLFFPIVGFRWVAVDDPNVEGKKRYVTIPTTCNAACNFKANLQTKKEETYGWFSSCCKIEDNDETTPLN